MKVDNWFITEIHNKTPLRQSAHLTAPSFKEHFQPRACRPVLGGESAATSSKREVGLVSEPALPASAVPEQFEGLSLGQRGLEVKRVQNVLRKWNGNLGVPANGVFDKATSRALTLYKSIYGGEGGGEVVDSKTARYLRQMEDGTFWNSPPVKTPQQEMLYHASRQLGKPYVMGGDGLHSTDCGRLTSDAFSHSGLGKMSRLADMQFLAARQGEKGLQLHRREPEPGDLIFFRVPTSQSSIAYDGVTHVTLYVGDGLTLAASSAAGKVVLQPLSQLENYLAGFGRLQPS